MAAVLREIVVDCADARRAADFWSGVLGWAVQEKDDDLWMTGRVGDTPWVVLADPDGNEFCVLGRRVDEG